MAKNIYYVMTWIDACRKFKNDILPYVQHQYEQDCAPDWVARSEEWSNWTDSLCQSGQISDWQYENWSHPACCGE